MGTVRAGIGGRSGAVGKGPSLPRRRRLFEAAACALIVAPLSPAQDAGRPPAGERPIIQKLDGTTATLTLVPIPAGEATAPDASAEGGTRRIPIAPFHISATEVTWDLYDLYVFRLDDAEAGDPDKGADAVSRPSKPYIPPDRGFGHAGYPAISMTFEGAEGFCRWLSQRTGRRYRLPTEAEWEHAARAGAPAGSTLGAGITTANLGEHAWFHANSPDKTQPVGKKAATPWGLHDIHGNAAEWVRGHDSKPTTKGGSYRDGPDALAIPARRSQEPAWNASDPQFPKSSWWLADCTWVGFRVVLEPDPPAATSAPAGGTAPPGPAATAPSSTGPKQNQPKEPSHGSPK